ncbi:MULTISPECIES: glycosyltransferase [unclassified Sedimentibacter]|uniref:glycosyltransferase n=1 Tax=unclassified Sedimentibacter TaxID=2649220 RepID=UPI0027E19E65|nr:glycosyltransferase [Sedimentibacter sp. MB35-C1]WMJ78081.1 glycosyltransferase [Sedimentibacter sp. MB35-C1]
MDILFLGGVFDNDSYIKKSKKSVQNAANLLQWNIVNGIESGLEKPVNILNSVFVGSFPEQYSEIFIKSYNWNHVKGALDRNVGFINIAGIKHITRACNLSKEIKKWASQESGEKIIIAYAMHTPFLYAIRQAKKTNPEIKICLIVPDLPQFMKLGTNPGVLYRIFKPLDIKLINKLIKYIDYYVFLTKHMAEYFHISAEKYVVVEGMVDSNEIIRDYESISHSEEKEKTILYTGTLNFKYGIQKLLDAFKLIDRPNYKLLICGAGEAKGRIVELSKSDSRVEYLGLLNRQEVVSLQRKATVLINPRGYEDEYTKYSFPSKIMEYLKSGRPTIAYKLPGIPEEYDKFIYFINDMTAESMASKILQVCEEDSDILDEFGRTAKEFVLTKKNNIKQCEKIINLLTK